MGIRRNSDGKFCPRSFCQFSNVWPFWFLGLMLMTGLCACDLHKEQKSAEPPAQQVQKMPLPQRASQPPAEGIAKVPAEKKEAASVAGQKPKPAQTVAVNGTKPVSKPATPAVPAVAKPSPKAAPKPAEITKKVEAPPANGKKPLPLRKDAADRKPVAVVKTEAKDARQLKKAQQAVAERKGVSASGANKTKMAAEQQRKKVKLLLTSTTKKTQPAPVKTSARNWTVVAGPYLLEEDLATDLAKVGKLGLNTAVQSGVRRKTAMHRLYMGQFNDRATAQAELEKLNKLTSDGFILDRGGKYAVYAGSYLLGSRAQSEKERMAAAGIALTIGKNDVAIPTKNLIAGTYRDKAAAESAAKKMRNAGLKCVQVRH